MTDTKELPDQEPAASPPIDANLAQSKAKRKALTTLRRDLSDKELTSPAVQKLLLDEVDRLESENEALSLFRDRFHASDRCVGVLEQKVKIVVGQEIISGACVTIGGALVGYAPNIWSVQAAGPIVLAAGIGLIVLGVFAKVVVKS